MAVHENHPRNPSSEYYNLSGESPTKESNDNLMQKKRTNKIAFLFVVFSLIAIWFWWNFVQISASSK